MHQITEYELELMKIIWANGNKALYADIAKALEDRGTPWTKNTIITLSSRLIAKGFLKTAKIGRRNDISPSFPNRRIRRHRRRPSWRKSMRAMQKGLYPH